MAKSDIGRRFDEQPTGQRCLQTATIVGARNGHGEAGEHSLLRSRAVLDKQPGTEDSSRGPARRLLQLARADERQRLVRDLHDGVQNELLSLILRLKLAGEVRTTPSALTATFVALEDHAAAALASLREIASGIYPLPPVKLGLAVALRAQAARAPNQVTIAGTTPRSTDQAEAAVYLCCSEAIQNVAKHAGPSAQVKLGLHPRHGMLAVRIEDDGRGFDATHTPDGAGLKNIRERIRTLDGTLKITSTPGHGTVPTISLAWPPRQPAIPQSQSCPQKRGSGSARSC